MTKENNKWETLKQVFSQILSINEPIHTKIPSFELVVGLVFNFFGQAKSFRGIESTRRSIIEQTGTPITPPAFHDRLQTKKIHCLLYQILTTLAQKLIDFPLRGKQLCHTLGVKDIQLLDSSSFSLRKALADCFPGTYQKAAFKWHYGFSLLSGSPLFSEQSTGSSHDSQHFPPLSLLQGMLILFDLGYYSYSLFQELKANGAFFFSRVKSGSALKIISIEKGLPLSCLGKKLSELESAKYYKRDIDAIAEIKQDKEVMQFRIVGFYNKKERCYHFYVTNLEVEVGKLRKLYNLRWQVELMFKGSQQSLSIEEYSTSIPEIVQTFFLSSLVAQMVGMTLFQEGCEKLEENEKGEEGSRISLQRVFLQLYLLAKDFKEYILSAFKRKPPLSFEEKIALFRPHLCDPYRKRKNSLQQCSPPIL